MTRIWGTFSLNLFPSLSNKYDCPEIFFILKPERLAYQSFNHIWDTTTSFPKAKIREWGGGNTRTHIMFPFPKSQLSFRIRPVFFTL